MRVQRGAGVACMFIFGEGVRHGGLGRFGHVGVERRALVGWGRRWRG
jgi:hypothetical protein